MATPIVTTPFHRLNPGRCLGAGIWMEIRVSFRPCPVSFVTCRRAPMPAKSVSICSSTSLRRLLEQVGLPVGPRGNRRRPIGPGQHGHHGKGDHARERVPPVDFRAGIFEFRELFQDVLDGNANFAGHDLPSVQISETFPTENIGDTKL